MPGLWPMLAFAALRSYLQARERLRAVVVATVVANVATFALDVVFVFGHLGMPALGAPGSGLVTSLCSLFQFALLAKAVRPGRRQPPRSADLRKALSVGIPVGLQMGAEVGVFALVGVLAGRLGAQSLAAHQVAISLASFTFCAAVGVGMAGTVRVGWAVGARDTPAARRAGLTAFLGGAAIMSVAALCFWLLPGALAVVLQRPAPRLDPARPLLFSGQGSSFHAARVAAAWAGYPACAVEAHDLALRVPIPADAQVVAISHSGGGFTKAVLRKARS